MAKLPPNKGTVLNAAEDTEQQEFSFNTDGNEKWYCHFGRPFGSILQSPNIIPLSFSSCVSVYPVELKTYIYTVTCK